MEVVSEDKKVFNNIFFGKKVLITGNTGFKGSWLSLWLIRLGANVIGYSDKVPTSPSLFDEAEIEKKIMHNTGDISDRNKLNTLINDTKPDYIFHLAAQAIVSTSFKDPLQTYLTNVQGTATLLDILKDYGSKCVAVIITSDKCYDNVEWVWGYRETDRLGGKDPYSASKACAELVFRSYFESFFNNQNSFVKLGVARAGNVLGGGDWSQDRLVVDAIKNWSSNKRVQIRNPNATRPWQHVLEPLSGYLTLAEHLSTSSQLNGAAFNFGPNSSNQRTVKELLIDLSKKWFSYNNQNMIKVLEDKSFHEAGILKLNCDKAAFDLSWTSVLNYRETVEFISDWYWEYYNGTITALDLSLNQISSFEDKALERSLNWISK
ncbi:MAG: CDP-glucose 4,6-dehydratase [Amylibacter sp.]